MLGFNNCNWTVTWLSNCWNEHDETVKRSRYLKVCTAMQANPKDSVRSNKITGNWTHRNLLRKTHFSQVFCTDMNWGLVGVAGVCWPYSSAGPCDSTWRGKAGIGIANWHIVVRLGMAGNAIGKHSQITTKPKATWCSDRTENGPPYRWVQPWCPIVSPRWWFTCPWSLCAGVPGLITADMVKEGAAVIDVGINRIQDPKTGKLRLIGDVDFEGK